VLFAHRGTPLTDCIWARHRACDQTLLLYSTGVPPTVLVVRNTTRDQKLNLSVVSETVNTLRVVGDQARGNVLFQVDWLLF